jgi:hypothetical protein
MTRAKRLRGDTALAATAKPGPTDPATRPRRTRKLASTLASPQEPIPKAPAPGPNRSRMPARPPASAASTSAGAGSLSYIAVSELAVRIFRLRASQLLPPREITSTGIVPSPPRGTAAAASILCRELLGLQAQETSAAALSLWNRMHGPFSGPAPSRETLQSWFSTDPGHLVRCHGQRGTMHLYDPGVTWPLMAAIQHDRLTARREKAAGGEPLRNAVAALRAKLERGEIVTAADLPSNADFSLRYGSFMMTCLTGLGARIDLSGGSVIAPRNVIAPDYSWATPALEDSIISAARVYFSAFAPASEQDFRYYLGITAPESKKGVQFLRDTGELATVNIMSRHDQHVKSEEFTSPALVMCSALEALLIDEDNITSLTAERLPVMLLGRFDVLLLGHMDKSWIVPRGAKSRVWSNNGIVRAVVLVQGRACAVWKHVVRDKHLTVTVSPFPGVLISPSVLREVDSKVEALARVFFAIDTWETVLSPGS